MGRKEQGAIATWKRHQGCSADSLKLDMIKKGDETDG